MDPLEQRVNALETETRYLGDRINSNYRSLLKLGVSATSTAILVAWFIVWAVSGSAEEALRAQIRDQGTHLSEQLTTSNGRITRLDERAERGRQQLKDAIVRLDNNVDMLDEKVDSLDKKVDRLDSKIDLLLAREKVR